LFSQIFVYSLFTEEDEKKLLRRLKSLETEKTSTANDVNGEDTATAPIPQATLSSK
jgi:hypothetical protein